MKSQSVLSTSVRGSGYNIAVSAVTIVLGFVRSVLLMRLLVPDQFGVVALALFFMTFLRPFSTFGIDFALIQRQEVKQATFATHFVMRLALALLVLAIIVIFGIPIYKLIFSIYSTNLPIYNNIYISLFFCKWLNFY